MNYIKRLRPKKNTGSLIRQINMLANKLYNKLPRRLNSIAIPLIDLYACFRPFPHLSLKLSILTGKERISNSSVSLLYAANDSDAFKMSNRNYLLNLIFADSYDERYVGQTWLWKIHKINPTIWQNCSFMIVHLSKSHLKFLQLSNCFYIPNWLIGETEIPKDPNSIKNLSLKSDFRRIRKHSLKFEVTKDLKLFDEFYRHMYLPYITAAHGSSAYVMSYDYLIKEFKKCELLLIKKQEKHIAGILIAYEDLPRLWSLGVRDSNPEYLKAGAVGGLFYYSLLYLKSKGYKTVNFGWSRAFILDGVLQYKRKWAQSIVDSTSYGYALKVISYTTPVKAFLQSNPFIFECHDGLQGAVYVNSDEMLSSDDFKAFHKKYFYDGLSKLNIYYFHDGDTISQIRIPQELSKRITLHSAQDNASNTKLF